MTGATSIMFFKNYVTNGQQSFCHQMSLKSRLFYEARDVIVVSALYKEKKEGILVTTRSLRERLLPKQNPSRFASFSCFACVKTRETLKDG